MNNRRDGRLWAGRAVAGALLVVSGSPFLGGAARAATQVIVVLEYEIDPETTGCPDATAFHRSVERQLGYDPFRPIADSRVAVEIARKGAGFEGRIRWSDETGRQVGDRRLTSLRPGCEEIAANLAFSVAVQIQLIAGLAGPPETSPPPPVVVPAPAPVRPPPESRPPPAPPMPTPKPRRRLSLSMGLGPALAVGIAPHPTGVGRIFVSGGVSRFSLELAIEASLPSKEIEADGSGFSLDRFAAAAAACGHAGAVAACATATTGLLRARGFGVDVPASPTGWFSDLGARLAATRNLGQRFFATIRADGLVAVSSWTVNLNGTAIWTTPRLSATAGLDLGVRLF